MRLSAASGRDYDTIGKWQTFTSRSPSSRGRPAWPPCSARASPPSICTVSPSTASAAPNWPARTCSTGSGDNRAGLLVCMPDYSLDPAASGERRPTGALGQKSKVWSAGPGCIHTAWQEPGAHAARRRRRLHETGQRLFATTAAAFIEGRPCLARRFLLRRVNIRRPDDPDIRVHIVAD